MYLIPRLFGISIYVSIMLLMALLIRYSSSQKNIRRTLTVYWIIIGLMGYFFVPPEGFDLPRLIDRMHYYASMSDKKFQTFLVNTLVPGERLYYRFLGMFSNADQLLPCVSALIAFGFCFAILKDISKEDDSKADIALLLILFMARGSLMAAIDTVRAYMASAIIAWCVYQELVKGKSFIKHLLLYAFACSIHALGYILLLIRILHMVIFRQKSFSKDLLVRVAVISALLVSLVAFPDIWQMLLDKGEHYYEIGRAGEGYTYLWEGVLSGMSIMTAIFLLRCISKFTQMPECSANPQYVGFCRYFGMLIVVNILAIFVEYNFFMRLGNYVAILVMPLSFYALRLARQCKKQAYLTNRLLIIAFAMLLLACARGYLCSLKFFV